MELISADTTFDSSHQGEYVLAQGTSAVRRLLVLHRLYGPTGRRLLLKAGLERGMHVADFGCGVGATTRMIAEMVGPSGTVTGIDSSPEQIDQAATTCGGAGLSNVSFRIADACATGIPSHSFDVVYCRFLLLHLTNPSDGLREMGRVLKPGGILLVEDGDIGSAGSEPPTILNAGAALFMRLGHARGLNYSLANNLHRLVRDTGFVDSQIEIHQPAGCQGDHGDLLVSSIAEAGPAFVAAGIITAPQLEDLLQEMRAAIADPNLLVLTPRMSVVWARNPA